MIIKLANINLFFFFGGGFNTNLLWWISYPNGALEVFFFFSLFQYQHTLSSYNVYSV